MALPRAAWCQHEPGRTRTVLPCASGMADAGLVRFVRAIELCHPLCRSHERRTLAMSELDIDKRQGFAQSVGIGERHRG